MKIVLAIHGSSPLCKVRLGYWKSSGQLSGKFWSSTPSKRSETAISSAASATLRRIDAYLVIAVSLLDESHPHR
jgi:hypothetical protein